MADRCATADAVEGHADDLAVRLDVLDELADRLARDLEHDPGRVGEGLRRRQGVEDAAEGRDDRNTHLAHFRVDGPLCARETQPENAEHIVTLGLLLGRGDGAVGLEAVIVEDDVDLLAVDPARGR